MANPVIMPRQGQSVESCIITAWHKKKGDSVKEGEILFSYETDKSAFDEKSLFSGTVLEVLAAEGDVVPCLDTVCIIGESGEDVSAFTKGEKKEEKAESAKEEEKAPEVKTSPTAPAAESAESGRVFISPRAKNLALKTGADLRAATPTGPHGRIIERDVNAVLDRGERDPEALEAFLAGKILATEKSLTVSATTVPVVSAATAAAENLLEYTEIPMSGVRRATARAMCASLSEMAQLTLNSSFDATNLMEYRRQLKAGADTLGIGKISINDMVFYAVSRVLVDYPDINANLVGDKIRQFKNANIGLAVDTPRGLLVPTIFGANKMTLASLAAANKAAADKAREGSLTPDEMNGAGFTISNLGSLGVESFTPVVNPPQVAILGVCAVTNRLKADGTVYPAMGLSLTFDHRATDGAPAARFLKDVCAALENFSLLLAK